MNGGANLPIAVLRAPLALLRQHLENLRTSFYLSATEFQRAHLAMILMTEHPGLWTDHEILHIVHQMESLRGEARFLFSEIEAAQRRISLMEVDFMNTMRMRGVWDAVLAIREPDELAADDGEEGGNVEDDEHWTYRPRRGLEREGRANVEDDEPAIHIPGGRAEGDERAECREGLRGREGREHGAGDIIFEPVSPPGSPGYINHPPPPLWG
ncbi:uncharacterized protein LAJ45_01151 [Morchella importuna]|uniref:uncharacterized protein n=1 Tax=Morchella importuna TaxID=1174673 RepID=UPI001E8DC527|nr:uncharacterized protein LAJ45_01151 [Morchella importuna]KAH8154623.1 hypothetical protein LAJ45_01151 [Morchella importuna]